jgi:NADH-quinone oxidoreductase subunit B
MGLDERLPSGILLLSTVEKVAGYPRRSSAWPATFGLTWYTIEPVQPGRPPRDLAPHRSGAA